MISAVLTSDIVDSTLLPGQKDKELIFRLETILAGFRFEFYRGDSFQAYIREAKEALRIALLCRASAISLTDSAAQINTDVRISIGLGTVEEPVNTLATAKGEAFILSGRAFDELAKSGKRLIISSNHKLANIAFMVLADYLNSLFSQITAKQAEVILELLQGQTQQQVAEKLNKSKSTVSQHVTAGRWDEIEQTLNRYDQIIEQISI